MYILTCFSQIVEIHLITSWNFCKNLPVIFSSNSKPNDPPEKLPTPGFMTKGYSESVLVSSVFANPFTRAEDTKKAILEKHVKMVNMTGSNDVLNGRKICWNYRKGKCRFGHNCKYAHDSDIQKSQAELDAENKLHETVVCQSSPLPLVTSQDASENVQKHISSQKRKRPGLTQDIVPGKKVMKNYFKQKN